MYSTEDRGAEEKTEDVTCRESELIRYLNHPAASAAVDVRDWFAKRPFTSDVAVGKASKEIMDCRNYTVKEAAVRVSVSLYNFYSISGEGAGIGDDCYRNLHAFRLLLVYAINYNSASCERNDGDFQLRNCKRAGCAGDYLDYHLCYLDDCNGSHKVIGFGFIVYFFQCNIGQLW